MASNEPSCQASALVGGPSISAQSQKNGSATEPPTDLAARDKTAATDLDSKPAMTPIRPIAASYTSPDFAPHSALAGTTSQAISSPPAAVATSHDAAESSVAGAVTHTRKSLASSPSKMLFSDFYKSTKLPLSRLRQQPNPPAPGVDFDADLVSKDKAKNKEAVKRYLSSKIRNDWEFKWPLPNKTAQASDLEANGTTPAVEAPIEVSSHDQGEVAVKEIDGDNIGQDNDNDDNGDTASIYSTVSEDPAHFKPRLEWWSDLSDDDVPVYPSAYRFDTPDAVGPAVQASAQANRAKRRREIREEESWNSGLACFNARRDAWTHAKTARVKPKQPSTPTSPISPSRRMSFFRFASTSPPISPITSLSPTATRTSGDNTAVTSSDGDSKENDAKADPSQYPVETLLPIAPPLLPPANPMRASITPATYPNLYDRIIVHSLTPSCPVNLADILRSCVVGWKRDGEWPPRMVEPPPVVAVRKKKQASAAAHNRRPSSGRRMSLGFLGRRESAAADPQAGDAAPEDGSSGGKGIRKSIQRVLGIGHERTTSTASNTGQVA